MRKRRSAALYFGGIILADCNEKYILASASPRRRELFSDIAPDFSCIPSNADEKLREGVKLLERPEYLARLKAESVAAQHAEDIVVGCDTAVFIDGEMLTKPADAAQARGMLRKLSGREHLVITGCCICFRGHIHCFSQQTRVRFYPLSDCEIEQYIESGEPFDKAGAYGIQGRGRLFVESIEGDYFNIVGLPVARLKREITNFRNAVTRL